MSASASPLAYFITFSTYGTWLHGDQRGSVQRGAGRGEPSALLPPRSSLQRFDSSEMDQPCYVLDARRRDIVLNTMLEVATHRGWALLAAHVRINHVHTVVNAEAIPERVMNDFKAYASRRLNEARIDPPGRKRWSRHGSTRYLWTEEMVAAKVRYTVEEQGDPMAVFVAPAYAC